MKAFLVTADYRPNNNNKPTYKVAAKNKRVCKQSFEKKFSWLKVYDVVEFNYLSLETINSDSLGPEPGFALVYTGLLVFWDS